MSKQVFDAAQAGDVLKVTPRPDRQAETGYVMGSYGYAEVVKREAATLIMRNGNKRFPITAREATSNLSR
jgi:hypothetical protein